MAIESKTRVLTTREAAAFLGLQPDTIRKYVERKLIKPYRQIGIAYVFEESECRRFQSVRRPAGNPNHAAAK